MPRVSSHWKMPVPLPRLEADKDFGEIKGNDDADQACADPLQKAAEHQRAVAVRQRDRRDADDKQDAAGRHQGLTAHPVSQHASEQGGDDAPQQHGRDYDGKLAGVQTGSRLKIRQRAGDDADIHSVEQPAQTRYHQKKAVVEDFL